jgi:putative Mg2+ transporter-C (MgtC) family protein
MNQPIPLDQILLRVLAAMAAGAFIGWERESHGRPAGLRTTTLACTASALAMILSELLFWESATTATGGAWRPDPARLGAGILTGIGFLGAGTILRHNNLIRGVTTAASLWFVTVIGLAFGSGEFTLGGVGLAVAALALHALPAVEKHIQTDWYATLVVTMELDALDEAQLRRRIESLGLKIKAMELDYDLAAKQKTIRFELKLKRTAAFDLSARLLADLRACPGVLQAKWA